MAFGPERRLRKHSEFVRSQGDRSTQRVGTAHFTLLLAPQRAPGPSRLGLVVGRRIGGAVQRNRVKRLCRECFRGWPRLVPDGIDLIVIARTGAPELDLARVRAEWAGVGRLLEKRAAEALARAARDRGAAEARDAAEAREGRQKPGAPLAQERARHHLAGSRGDKTRPSRGS
jgi:ribonuclease P protein component